jgi:hypothetical protein
LTSNSLLSGGNKKPCFRVFRLQNPGALAFTSGLHNK